MTLIQKRAELARQYHKTRQALIDKYDRLMGDMNMEQEAVLLMADRIDQLRCRELAIDRLLGVFLDACDAAMQETGRTGELADGKCEPQSILRFLSSDILPIEEKWYQEDCLNMARLRDGIELKYKEYQEVSLQELMQENQTAT